MNHRSRDCSAHYDHASFAGQDGAASHTRVPSTIADAISGTISEIVGSLAILVAQSGGFCREFARSRDGRCQPSEAPLPTLRWSVRLGVASCGA